MKDIVRLSAAQRQHARAEMIDAESALDLAKNRATHAVGQRDAAFGLWAQLLSDRMAVPELISNAAAWVIEREHKLDNAEREAVGAHRRCADTAQAYGRARAREEVAHSVRAEAVRRANQRSEERACAQVEDLLLQRRRP